MLCTSSGTPQGFVLAQDPAQMGLVPDESPGQELAAASADPAFGEDVEDQSAAGGGGVQGLVQALEPDPFPAQRGDDLDEVGQGPG